MEEEIIIIIKQENYQRCYCHQAKALYLILQSNKRFYFAMHGLLLAIKRLFYYWIDLIHHDSLLTWMVGSFLFLNGI